VQPLGPPVVPLHILRLCSVFEPAPGRAADGATAALDRRRARYDPIGGMQNHTATLSRSLDALGHRQTVLTARLAAPRGVRPLGERARVHRTGLTVPHLRQLWAVAALPRALRPGGPRVDVVHAHQGEDLATLVLARLAARRHRCPLVVTVHCSVAHTLRGASLRARLLQVLGGRIERAALRRADAVVVLTGRTAAALRDDGVPAERVSVIPSGFDPALFAGPRTDAFPGVPRPRIGYVGRLAPQKRVDVLVRAFGQLRGEASLVIVGDGPDGEEVRRLAAAGPAAARTTMRGFVDHTAVPDVLSSLDLLVLPSVYEEMGSVLVEAMAAGLPVVASDVGGIPEVVRPGENGVLVPPDDVASLVDALERLAGDPRERARLAACARALSEAYAWPALAARVAHVYAAVLGSTPRVPTTA
jgi:2-deoxystreptamine N-acetyl-D-glucosaminyltransferase/2-deoxystreptamine glucosyltransferase